MLTVTTFLKIQLWYRFTSVSASIAGKLNTGNKQNGSLYYLTLQYFTRKKYIEKMDENTLTILIQFFFNEKIMQQFVLFLCFHIFYGMNSIQRITKFMYNGTSVEFLTLWPNIFLCKETENKLTKY